MIIPLTAATIATVMKFQIRLKVKKSLTGVWWQEVVSKKDLRYYDTFKVRKFESLLYRINTCLQKITTCIGLRTEQIFSVNI